MPLDPDALADALALLVHAAIAPLVARVAVLESRAPIAGPAGRDGTNGRDGRDGANGKDGANGLDGKDADDGVTPKTKAPTIRLAEAAR